MSSGPETRFIASVHRFLPPVTEFHREKMANPYRGGTADSWYSGQRRDLWIEWKWVELPKREGTRVSIVDGKKPSLSVLQQQWIIGRKREGRDVWVIIGCKEGGVIHAGYGWAGAPTMTDFKSAIKSRADIAHLILDWCQ